MTINGDHTLSETRDQVNYYEWRIDKLNQAWQQIVDRGFGSAALRVDPTIADDWNAFLARWVAGRSVVKQALLAKTVLNPLVPAALVNTEDTYQALLHVISLTAPAYTPQDLPGLQARIQALRPNNPIDFTGQPPGDAFDLDLAAYKASADAWSGIKKGATAVQKSLLDIADENKGLIGLGIAGVLGYTYLTTRRR